MKRKSIILIAFVLALATLLLCCCSDEAKLDKAINNMTKSLNSVTEMTQSVTVTDGDVTVYTMEKKVTVDGDNVNVELTEGKLSGDFTLQTTTATSTSNKETQLVLPLTLSSENVAIFTLTNEALTCVITKDNLANVLGAEDYVSAGDVSVVCALNNNKLQEMTCSFVTVSSKTVTITVTCVY